MSRQDFTFDILVRDLLRHKDLWMTGRYVNRADDSVRTLSEPVGERIAAVIGGAGSRLTSRR